MVKKLFLFFIISLFFTPLAFGAVAYDSVSNTTNTINGVPGADDPTEVSHTISGTNTLLVVGTSRVDMVGNNVMDDNTVIASLTYNDDGMTYLGSIWMGASMTEVYYLVNPDTGAHTISLILDHGSNPGQGIVCTVGLAATSYTGVDQDNPIVQSGWNSGLSSPITITLADVVSGNMLVDSTVSLLTTTITAGADQTARVNQQYGTLGAVLRQGMSHQLASAGGVMSWTEGTTTRDWATFALEIGASTITTRVKDPIMQGMVIPHPR
jgi:hypothetical protein